MKLKDFGVIPRDLLCCPSRCNQMPMVAKKCRSEHDRYRYDEGIADGLPPTHWLIHSSLPPVSQRCPSSFLRALSVVPRTGSVADVYERREVISEVREKRAAGGKKVWTNLHEEIFQSTVSYCRRLGAIIVKAKANKKRPNHTWSGQPRAPELKLSELHFGY